MRLSETIHELSSLSTRLQALQIRAVHVFKKERHVCVGNGSELIAGLLQSRENADAQALKAPEPRQRTGGVNPIHYNGITNKSKFK